MFDSTNISYNLERKQYICSCQCDSSQAAEELCASYIRFSRMVPSGEMFSRGATAFIGAATYDDVYKVAEAVNANRFMQPLDIVVFYGSNKEKLPSRWCVGFDFPNSTRLIDFLNSQGPIIIADKNPQNWFDKNGTSYSVVMLTGVLEQEQSEELEKRVNLCLSVIQNVTAREFTVRTIQ